VAGGNRGIEGWLSMAIRPTAPALPILAFATQAAFDTWLKKEGARSSGIWLKLARKASGIASISQQEAIETALCHGWIDGQLDKCDDQYWLVRFTPRQAKSKWSQKNRSKAEALIAAGRMQPAGLQQVNLAKADGRWDAAYAPQSSSEVPADLIAALSRNKKAKAFFATLNRSNLYAILYRLHEAKKPETRARRLATFIGMLERGETLHLMKPKGTTTKAGR
jgi:uncharacterized protein YdeI (YjbR/CyaY-like superfamily)